MSYIALDLEFNQYFDFPHAKTVPNPYLPAEIVEFGAVRLTDAFEPIETFCAFVHPTVYPRMHPHVSRLTGIKTTDLKKSPSFEYAYSEFISFLDGEDVTLIVWGVDDMRELIRNVLFYKLPENDIPKKFINVQKIAAELMNNPNGAVNLKTAAGLLGLPLLRPFHDALADAIYTAEILKAVDTDPTPFIRTADVEQVRGLADIKIKATAEKEARKLRRAAEQERKNAEEA
ncbi:hypothetical protein FACS189490_13050 [Clostridia bacterium]|nr:hypothetical protein FACS189490_13050 [Clostridia bacterium]